MCVHKDKTGFFFNLVKVEKLWVIFFSLFGFIVLLGKEGEKLKNEHNILNII